MMPLDVKPASTMYLGEGEGGGQHARVPVWRRARLRHVLRHLRRLARASLADHHQALAGVRLRRRPCHRRDELLLEAVHGQARALLGHRFVAPGASKHCALRPGTILVVDNWRVLHGRTAFTGKRVMAGAYLHREDVESRWRHLTSS